MPQPILDMKGKPDAQLWQESTKAYCVAAVIVAGFANTTGMVLNTPEIAAALTTSLAKAMPIGLPDPSTALIESVAEVGVPLLDR